MVRYAETGVNRVIYAAHTISNLVFDESRQQTAFGTTSGDVEFWDLLTARVVNTIPAAGIQVQIP